MEKLVILDYSKGMLDIYDVNPGVTADERYIEELGHNPNECSWMFKEDVTVRFNKEVLR